MADTNVDRTVRLNVRLNEDMYSKLSRVAEYMGVPASTLGAIAVAEYVNQRIAQIESLKAMNEKGEAKMNEMLQGMATNPEHFQALFQFIANMEKDK